MGSGAQRSRKEAFPLEAALWAESQGGDRHTACLMTLDATWLTEQKGAGRSHPQERKRKPCCEVPRPRVLHVLLYKDCVS